jgi:hypothetical protein
MQAFVNVAKVAAGSYNDIAGNLGTGGTSDNFVIDSVAPSATITLSDTFLLAGETALVTIQFDEAVTDFGLDDLFVGIGSLSDFTKVDEDTYEVTLTPIPDAVGGATVDLLPTTYSDLAGNLGGGASAKFVFDTLVPTVAITFDDTELFQGETATVTFEFSEDVTGFDDTDVTVENGALSGFLAVDGNTYTATFTPTDMVFDLTNVATIGAGSYTDLPGNPGAAGESANYEVRTTPAPVPTSVDYDEANNVLRLTGTGFTGVTGVDLTGSVWDFRAAGSSTGTYTFEAGDVLSFKVDSDTLLLITFASETASDIENTTDYGGTLLDIDQIDLLAGAIVVANSSPSVSDLDVTII